MIFSLKKQTNLKTNLKIISKISIVSPTLKAVDNMGQLVYDYGPHNVNPDIFSEEKEKNEKLYFLAYPTDKENDFTTSIEKFKERLSVKYTNNKKYIIVLRISQGRE